MEYYSAIKKNEITPFCSNMDGPRNHTKQGKSERERKIPYDNHLYVESKIQHK